MKKLLWWIFQENTCERVSFLIKFLTYRVKKDSCAGVSCAFYQIFHNAAFAKHPRVTASAKYPFLFVTSTSATKNASFDFGYFKYFRDKHCELLSNSSFRRITRRVERGEVSPALYQKLEKSPLIWRKIVLIVVIHGYNFSFKTRFLRVSRRINQKSFPCGTILSRAVGGCLSKCPNSKKTLLP